MSLSSIGFLFKKLRSKNALKYIPASKVSIITLSNLAMNISQCSFHFKRFEIQHSLHDFSESSKNSLWIKPNISCELLLLVAVN